MFLFILGRGGGKGREKRREEEKHQSVASHGLPEQGLTPNLGMMGQPTELPGPGCLWSFKSHLYPLPPKLHVLG